MKNLLFIGILLCGFKITFSQGDVYLNSSNFDFINMNSLNPETWEFHRVQHLTPDLYTGTANISIPIFNIELNRLNIPISLSYNTKGIKVKSVSSRVGQNWTLNAGGIISRSVRGRFRDFESHSYRDGETRYEWYGWQNHYQEWGNLIGNGNPVKVYDTEPDIFYLSAPGLNSVFMIDKSNNAHVLSGDKIYISFIVEDFDLPEAWYGDIYSPDRIYPNIKSIFVTSVENGNKYYFEEEDWNFCVDMGPRLELNNWFLSKIITTYGDEIEFFYDDLGKTETAAFNVGVSRSADYYYPCGQIEFKSDNWTSLMGKPLNSKKRLKRIISPICELDFNYSHNRLDIDGDFAISEIVISDKFDKEVKTYEFNYGYIKHQNTNTRLRLDEIDIKNNNIELGSYLFDYFPGEVPRHNSFEYDYGGYFNSNGASDETSRIYAKIGTDIKNTRYYPYYYEQMNWPSSSKIVFSGEDRMPNEISTKSGVLKRITYPTGGYCQFDYELNNNKSIDLPGLRVFKQTIGDGQLCYTKYYRYVGSKTSDFTYGMLTVDSKYELGDNPSNSEKREFVENYSAIFYSNMLNSDFYNGHSIVYPVVIEEDSLSGSIWYMYDTPIDDSPELSIYPNSVAYGCNYTLQAINDINPSSNYPFFPGRSNMFNRGILHSKWFIDNNNRPIKAVLFKNEYLNYEGEGYLKSNMERFINRTKSTQIIRTSNKVYTGKNLIKTKYTLHLNGDINITYEQGFGHYPIIFEQLESQDPRLMEYIEMVEKETYEYNADLFPIRETKWVNAGFLDNSVKIHYNHFSFPNAPYIKGIRKTVLKTHQSNKVIEGREFSYNYNNGIIRKQSEKRAVVNSSSWTFYPYIVFNEYGNKANLLQYTVSDNPPTSYLWGYNQTLPVAEVKNAKHDEVHFIHYEPNANEDIVFEIYGDSHTGNYSRRIPPGMFAGVVDYSMSQLTSGKYVLSGWFKTTGKALLIIRDYHDSNPWKNKSVNSTGGEWKYFELVVDLNASEFDGCTAIRTEIWNHGNIDVLVDDIKFRPLKSEITTYTHDPLVGLTSVTDANGRTQYYEYDGLGRLVGVRDDEGNLLEQHEYRYREGELPRLEEAQGREATESSEPSTPSLTPNAE